MNDDLTIPDFLRRPPPTPEQLARIKRLTASIRAPKIKLRNPPKRARAETALLGMSPLQLKGKAAMTIKTTNRKPLGAKEAQMRALKERKTAAAPKAERAAKAVKAVKAATEKPPKPPKAAKPGKKPAKAPAAVKDAATGKTTVRPGSKLEAIVGLLTRPEGCISADVLKATGWNAVSMPQMANAAGLELTKKKEDGITRYWGK